MPRKASLITGDYLVQAVNSAEAEKPWSRVITEGWSQGMGLRLTERAKMTKIINSYGGKKKIQKKKEARSGGINRN